MTDWEVLSGCSRVRTNCAEKTSVGLWGQSRDPRELSGVTGVSPGVAGVLQWRGGAGLGDEDEAGRGSGTRTRMGNEDEVEEGRTDHLNDEAERGSGTAERGGEVEVVVGGG